MWTVVRQSPVGVRQRADQVEQRNDARVRMAVVVAEQSFVGADQAEVDIRGAIAAPGKPGENRRASQIDYLLRNSLIVFRTRSASAACGDSFR